MNKFTWKNIMKSNAYILTQGEYGFEQKHEFKDYILRCEYLIDNTMTDGEQKIINKKEILDFFHHNVDEWENKIDIKIMNVAHLGYHIYMIDMPCYKHGSSGDIVALAYVHKNDLQAYLGRRNN